MIGGRPDPSGSSDHREAQAPRLWLLWGSIASSTLIYALIGYLVRVGTRPIWERETGYLITVVFAAAALGLVYGIFALRRTLARRMAYLPFLLLRWAMAEGIALLALVLIILGGSWVVGGVLLALTVAVHLVLMPTGARRREYLEARGQMLVEP